MNKWSFILGIIICVFIGMWGIYESWPIVQSESKIRREMLKKFPKETKKDIVWGYVQKYNKGGSYDISKRKTGWRKDYHSDPLVGVSHVRATVSELLPISVSVIWMFDEDDKLIDIAAWKTIDFF